MSKYLHERVQERRSRLIGLQRDLAAIQREIDLATGELRAYEDALRNAPGLDWSPTSARRSGDDKSAVVKAHESVSGDDQAYRAGHWSDIISHMIATRPRFTTDDVEKEMRDRGHEIQRKSIRSKLATLVNTGKLTRLSEGVFSGAIQPVPFTNDTDLSETNPRPSDQDYNETSKH